MEYNKKQCVKSPLNYTGGKSKLLPQILPLFPDKLLLFHQLSHLLYEMFFRTIGVAAA